MIKKILYPVIMRANKTIMTVAILLFACRLFAQTLSPTVYPAQGGSFTGGNINLQFTIGEPLIQTFTAAANEFSLGFEQPEMNITLDSIADSPFCAGTVIHIPFKTTGIFPANNVFTAQLSDSSGNFTGALNIATDTAQSSDTLIAIIPFGIAPGTHYRIRIADFDPALPSTPPVLFISSPSNFFTVKVVALSIGNILNSDSVTILTASGGISYVWSNGISDSIDTCSIPGMYFVTVTNTEGCSALGATIVTPHPLVDTTTPPLNFHIVVPSSYNLNNDTTDASRLSALLAANSTANSVLSGITITAFHSDFPLSDYEYLRNIFLLTCTNTSSNDSAIFSLHTLDSTNFPSVQEVMPSIPTSSYTPNDYHGIEGADCSIQLDYLNAPVAWGITKGNPALTIGINEARTGCDIYNPDMGSQIIGSNQDLFSTPPSSFHGTAVAGCVAAHTDNNIGVAGIGFKCSLFFNNSGTDAASLSLSTQGYRIINCSWQYGNTPTYSPANYVSNQLIYDEVYENGSNICFGAGNGELQYGGHFAFQYPSSLDHNISVGPVGYANAIGTMSYWSPSSLPPGGIPFNWKDCHEESPGSNGAYNDLNYNANDRVDICAPAYNVVSTSWDANNSSVHYSGGNCGTSFASPIVAGTLGLMLSANSCLSPYQLEYLLKTTARSMEDVEYNGVNLNAAYVGKMGWGALDAGAAVTAASTFDCNDLNTQTMYIQGIELNTICAPGNSSNSVNPQFNAIVVGGTPPYTYRWDPIPGNNTTLDNLTITNPTVTSSTGNNLAYYRLGVYDNSAVQQVATKVIKVSLTTSQTAKLVLRDSYIDMLNEPNTQVTVNFKDWNIWQSPDIWNRVNDDHVTVHQDPIYYTSFPNYVNVRVRNVGCTASAGAGNDNLYLYWSKASTGENWDLDWTTATVLNTSGVPEPAGGVITSSPLSISALNPGDVQYFSTPWYPPSPEDYDPSLHDVDVCFLGRIETSSSTPYGMTYPEVTAVKQNIINNNKIATRNLVVSDDGVHAIGPGNTYWHEILFANADSVDHQFSIEILPEKEINKHFAGDLSAYAQASIGLSDLYDRWVAGGSLGTNITSVDSKTKAINFSGDSKILLQNITIHANEKIASMVGVQINAQPLIDQYFYIRQWLEPRETLDKCPYGNVSFLIQGSDTTVREESRMLKVNKTNPDTVLPRILLYPNPTAGTAIILYQGTANNTISYTVTDITGKILTSRAGIDVFNNSENVVDLSLYQDGLYFISVTDSKGKITIKKIVKQSPK